MFCSNNHLKKSVRHKLHSQT